MALEEDLEQNLRPHLHGEVWSEMIVQFCDDPLRQRRPVQVCGDLERKAEEVCDLHVHLLLLHLELTMIRSPLDIATNEL